MFLLGTIIVSAAIALVLFVVIIAGKKSSRLVSISIGVVLTLFGIWVADRFIVGAFCLPWECVSRNIDLESLLLDNADLPDDWMVNQTFDYAYIPRASAHYRERTFYRESLSANSSFNVHLYEYRSVRGASFQYDILRYQIPTSYSAHSTPLIPEFDLQINNASKHDFGCVFYDMKFTVCFYLARYDEYLLVLEMRFKDNKIQGEFFAAIVKLADSKFSMLSFK